MATAVLDDPAGYGRVVRAPDGTVERVVETKAAGDATDHELHIREVNTGIFAFDGAAAARRARSGPRRQRPGRALPPRRAPDPSCHRAHRRRPRALRPDRDAGDQRPRRRWPRCGRVAQRRIHERLMVAGVTIVDPAATVDRRRRRGRGGHAHRPVHEPPRPHPGRCRRDRRPARDAARHRGRRRGQGRPRLRHRRGDRSAG